MPAALRDRSGSCTLPCAVPRGGRSADAGAFGNDTAADFADVFDDTESEAREALIRGVLIPTIDATGHLPEADEAVAAALIAARCPGGEPVDTPYGPETPMPLFPSDFRALADEALARIADDENGPASNWVGPEDRKKWRGADLGSRGRRQWRIRLADVDARTELRLPGPRRRVRRPDLGAGKPPAAPRGHEAACAFATGAQRLPAPDAAPVSPERGCRRRTKTVAGREADTPNGPDSTSPGHGSWGTQAGRPPKGAPVP